MSRANHFMSAIAACLLMSLLALVPAASWAQSTPAYTLAPQDQIEISVLNHSDFDASETILSDGTFSYPVVGTVQAQGLTAEAVSQIIAKGLSTQLNDPQVTVSVRQGRTPQVSVLGGVHAPGQHDYKAGMRLIDVLVAAGGLEQEASLTSGTLVTNSGKQSVPIDFTSVMSNGQSNVLVSPGDILFVQARDPAQTQVQIIGEVAKPGAYVVPVGGASVLSLLTQAGGATPKAALSRSQLMRAGSVRIIDLHALADSLDTGIGSMLLMPGDVLLVPTNKARVVILGEVRNPGPIDVPDARTLSLSDAIVDAGGLNSDADKHGAQIVRKGPDDKPEYIKVNLDGVLPGKSGAAEVQLAAGDVLYVPVHHHSGGGNLADVLGLAGLYRIFVP